MSAGSVFSRAQQTRDRILTGFAWLMGGYVFTGGFMGSFKTPLYWTKDEMRLVDRNSKEMLENTVFFK